MANLRDKYCIIGVGETEYSRNSGRTTRAMGVEAVRNAMNDAGLNPGDIDGMLSYHGNDSTSATAISSDLGMRLNFFMDVIGGGSSTEALIGMGTGGDAGARRRTGHAPLWHAQCRPELRADVHAPYA